MQLRVRDRWPIVLLALAACEPVAMLEPVQRLSETGLYADIATHRVASDVIAFEPQYPLWSDGASKRRWIRLPAGSSIDASDPNAWIFPVGTQLWKEFAFETRVETRYLEKREDGTWLRVSYAWDADQRDARIVPASGLCNAAQSTSGLPYDIPSRTDCASCHAQGDGVLGFSSLQLSADRDPLALHATRSAASELNLATLVKRGLVVGLQSELLQTPPRIQAANPRERAVLGYLHANCGTCHSGSGLLSGLDLKLSVNAGSSDLSAIDTTVDRPSRYRPADWPHDPIVRVQPGSPAASTLLARMSTRFPAAQMPPIGTHCVDVEALALIESWIRDDLAVRESEPRTEL